LKQNSIFPLLAPLDAPTGVEAPGGLLQVLHVLKQVPAHFWTTDRALRLTWGQLPFTQKGHSMAASLPSPKSGSLANLGSNDERHTQTHRRALEWETVSYEIHEGDRVFSARVGPLRAINGKIVGCVGTAVDITHQQVMMRRLWELASTDSMTGLANYRRLLDCIAVEMKRTERTERSFSVLMLDLDGLKAINDTHGHLCGSRALCRVADAIRSQCRATDLAARYGGDEFCLVLPETSVEGAMAISKRISETLANETETPAVSVSAGAATFPLHARNAEQLIEAADRELYAAKDQAHHRARNHAKRRA
jgi:diguanylate cyclase (GGDEF)-like protein